MLDKTTMISDLLKAIEDIKDSELDSETALEVYHAAKDLMIKVESNHDFQHRIGFGHNALVFAQIGFDLGIFEILSEDPANRWTLEELILNAEADTELLARMLRGMSAYNLIGEDHDGKFYANKSTNSLLVPGCRARVKVNNLFATNLINGLPSFLKKRRFRSVTDPKDTVLHEAFDTDLDALEYISSRPELLQASQELFRESSVARKKWMWSGSAPMHDFDVSPNDHDRSRVICVDVGGGLGHQLIELRKACTSITYRFVLQDLPKVIELAKSKMPLEVHRIEAIVQDIFKPQTTIGAKVYYLRAILHNFADDRCRVILKHLNDAMAPDPVLWIDGLILAEHQPDYKSIDYDLMMMCGQAGMERSLSQWERLLDSADFKIRDVWRCDADDGIIAAVPNST